MRTWTLLATLAGVLVGCSDGVLLFGKDRPAAPACAVASPAEGAQVPPELQLCLVASDADTAPEELAVVWTDLDRGDSWAGSTPGASGESCTAVVLELGDHSLSASVTDAGGQTGTCGVDFEVEALQEDAPGEPVPPLVSVSPEPATTQDALIAALVQLPRDADGNELAVVWRWERDGERQEGLTEAEVSAELTARGETWTVTAIAEDMGDGDMGADMSGSASVVIANSAPGAPGVVVSPDPPTETLDGLLCSLAVDAEDPDGDALDYTISWELDGVLWTGDTETTLITGDTLPVGVLDEDDGWTCRVVASDGELDGPPGTAATTVLERRFVGVSAGAWHACAWDDLGRTTCWGDDHDDKVSDTPADSFAMVDASTHHSCGLTTAGSLRCWGVDDGSTWDRGQVTDTPTGSGYTALGCAGTNNCVADASGALSCWGSTDDGRSNPPSGTGFTEIVGGVSWLCATGSAGVVQCWGEYAHGVGAEPTDALEGLSGGNHACGLRKSDGTALCWGFDDAGQTSTSSDAYDVVSAGQKHSCGVRTDGSLDCWGSDDVGESSPPAGTFVDVSAASHVDDSVDYFSCGVDIDHEVFCWGADTFGQVSDRPGGPR